MTTELKIIIEADRVITIRAIAEKLNSSKTIVSDRIERLIFKKPDMWKPHNVKGIHAVKPPKLK